MYQFFETIKLIDGEMPLLNYHSKRLNLTRKEIFKCHDFIDLSKAISIPEIFKKGLFKCKVIYDTEIKSIIFEEYILAKHQTVLLVEKPKINYPYKATDRKFFDTLSKQYPEFSDLIILKKGHIYDALYSNIALFKDNVWVTPSTYLLKGIKRDFLLESKKISEMPIKAEDLKNFEKIAFINAMRDFEKIYRFRKEGLVLNLTLD